jgi:death-on-curing protein
MGRGSQEAGRIGDGDRLPHSAAYLFHIVKNHPFTDGNKRAGAVAARVFLRLNGWDVPLSEAELYDLVIGVAEGRTDKPSIAQAFRTAAVRLP